MHISLVGVNHQTTPLIVREKVAISNEKLCESLLRLQDYIPRGIIISTCNRTEIYAADNDRNYIVDASINYLRDYLNISAEDLLQYVYVYSDKKAVEHLFRVACGLESMIVGEFEVLGQVGQALENAGKMGTANPVLRHVFQEAIRTGRRVRDETGISRNALSTSSVAVDLASSIIGDIENARIIIIGAGEAGRLVVKVARERGASRIIVASRTKQRAEALAETIGGTPIDLSNLPEELNSANVVVTCASAPHWVLDFNRVNAAMTNRPGMPLVIIDIAVPRNVEPSASNISNVYLYNIDNLIEIADSHRKQRESEVQKTEEIIKLEIERVNSWWQELKMQPVISALMNRAEEIRSKQLGKTLARLDELSNEQREILDAMTKSMVNKILKEPIHYLKTNADNGVDTAELIAKIFQLDGNKQE